MPCIPFFGLYGPFKETFTGTLFTATFVRCTLRTPSPDPLRGPSSPGPSLDDNAHNEEDDKDNEEDKLDEDDEEDKDDEDDEDDEENKEDGLDEDEDEEDEDEHDDGGDPKSSTSHPLNCGRRRSWRRRSCH